MAKRRASGELAPLHSPEADPASSVRVTPLGAGQEVGRSCIILEYQGRKVMLDCGIHPGLHGASSLPYLTNEDLDEISVALITHFHLDHCAAVPYLIGHTTFKGRIFMTHPTKAIFHTLVNDFATLAASSGETPLYTKQDVEDAMARIEVLDFDQTVTVDGITFTAYRAGHVLGAAMFMVDIDGMTCLYTGDYSRVTDRHLSTADLPPVRPHIVIVESTYGTQLHGPREARERLFTDRIAATVRAGGRVLLPIVAIGRAQEVLLLLEDYWSRHPQLQGIPIYQASGVARRALNVFQTYVGMMNEDIQAAFQFRNPFSFKHVKVLKAGTVIDESGPCVVMATPSMMQSGLSRELFEAWCESPANTVIIADFAVQGTLAREILSSPTHITTRTGVKVPLRCRVEAISFSAHADYDQTSGFLDALQPPHVVLVHGEFNEMMRLRSALERSAAAKGWSRTLHTPKTDSSAFIPFAPRHVAHVRGRLAAQPPKPGAPLRGVLVSQEGGAAQQLLHPDDLAELTKLTAGRVLHRQAVAIDRPFAEVRLALEVMFEGVEGAGHLPVRQLRRSSSPSGTDAEGAQGSPAQTQKEGPAAAAGAALDSSGQQQGQQAAAAAEEPQAVSVGGVVTVTHRPGDSARGYGPHVVLEWAGGSKGDVVADAVLAVLLQAAGEPSGAASAEAARAAALSRGDARAALAAEARLAAALLGAQFGPAAVDDATGRITLTLDDDGTVAHVDVVSGKVDCTEPVTRARLERALRRIGDALRPCALDFED